MTEPIKINGGAYKWVDTKDGYKTILDVPLVAEFSKGTKGIEYAGDKATLEAFVTKAQARYGEGNFCATAYKRHNPDIPLDHPDFAGFALPTRVGMAKTEQGDKLATFGNLKISDSKFEEAKAGKLPYLSPEISRFEKKIRGVAFLDTLPPHNEFPLFTIGEEVKDSAAAFAATPDTANFADADPAAAAKDDGDGDFAKKYPKTNQTISSINDSMGKLMAHFRLDVMNMKPTALPAEPNKPHGAPAPKDTEGRMNADEAAKFAALVNDNAEFKAKFAAMDNEKKAKALVEKADAQLSANIVSQALHDQLASFAADAVTREKGDEWFSKIIETLKPTLKVKPTVPGQFSAQGAGAASNDPVVAKLVKDGVDGDEAAKFAAQYDALEAKGFWERAAMDGNKCSKEFYVKNELSLAKAKRTGDLNENRR